MLIPQFILIFVFSYYQMVHDLSGVEAVPQRQIERYQSQNLPSPSSSSSSSIEIEREKICGQGKGHEPYRYHHETRRCYEGGQSGPCGENMLFYAIDQINGTCDCENKPRTLIYHSLTQKCYPIYTKAYCNRGQWLIINSRGQPTCETHRCYKFTRSGTVESVLINNDCKLLNSPCGPNKTIRFTQGKINPDCFENEPDHPVAFGVGISAPNQECRPGSSYSISGQCKPTFEF